MIGNTSGNFRRITYRGIGLNVGEQVEEGAGSLLGPRHFVTRGLVFLANGVSADTTGILGHGDSLLELQDVLQVGLGLADGLAHDRLSNLSGVLEVDSEVISTSLGGYIIRRNNCVLIVCWEFHHDDNVSYPW